MVNNTQRGKALNGLVNITYILKTVKLLTE